MNELNRRNTETVEQVLKEQNAKILEQHKRIDLLNTAVTNLTQKIIELETMLIIQKVKLTGTGPSVRVIDD